MHMKRWILAAATVICGASHAFTPAAGTWVVDSELNGKPGRGLAMDVQNGTLVMQMYAYERSGAATFYMGTANVNPAGNIATLPLKQYKDGRYLGSGDRSGVESSAPGSAVIKFSSATKGTITLPGEKEIAISRFEFGYPYGKPESLLSTWVFTGIDSTGTVNDRVDWAPLSEVLAAIPDGSGTVWTADGSIGCDQMVSGESAGMTVCIVRNATGIVRSYRFMWSVNEGEGNMYDADGKFLGAMLAKRLFDPKGNGVGFLRSAPITPDSSKSQAVDKAAWVQDLATAAAQLQK